MCQGLPKRCTQGDIDMTCMETACTAWLALDVVCALRALGRCLQHVLGLR